MDVVVAVGISASIPFASAPSANTQIPSAEPLVRKMEGVCFDQSAAYFSHLCVCSSQSSTQSLPLFLLVSTLLTLSDDH